MTTIEVNTKAKYLALLPDLFAYCNQSPNLQLCNGNSVISIIKVFSEENYMDSLRKCVFQGVDLVKFYNSFAEKEVELYVILLPKLSKSFTTTIFIKFD